MDYEALLKRGKEQLPEITQSSERFEMPKVKGHIQGNATIISNFHDIASILDRPKTHILKFLSKELATKGLLKKDQFAVFNTKLPASRINEKIEQYAQQYVICITCGKPETKIERVGQSLFLNCQACGAKNQIKRAI